MGYAGALHKRMNDKMFNTASRDESGERSTMRRAFGGEMEVAAQKSCEELSLLGNSVTHRLRSVFLAEKRYQSTTLPFFILDPSRMLLDTV